MVDQTLIAKIISIITLGLFAFICGVLPIKLKKTFENWQQSDNDKRKRNLDLVLSCISCFGAGVILTTCMAHMLPDANEFMVISIQEGSFPDTGFPLVEILVLVGFFTIYIVEEATHLVMSRWYNQKHSHDSEGHMTPEMILASAGNFKAMLRCCIIIVALGLHSVFEGIAIGLGRTPEYVWYLLFAIASHKYVIAFVIGLQFVTAGLKNSMVATLIAIFSVISPIGIGLGIALTYHGGEAESPSQRIAVTILNGLAAGTLLYVVFFEVLEKERAKKKNGIMQVTFMVLGFLFMVMVTAIELGTGSEEEEMKVIGGPHCTLDLASIDLSKVNGLNFTCNEGVLTFLE